jgi:hypothetical protein
MGLGRARGRAGPRPARESGERGTGERGAGEGDESVLWDRAASERGELRGWALASGLGPGRASRGRDRPVRGRKGKGSGWTRGKGSGPGSYWARGERREGELAGLFLEFWAGWGFGFTLFLFLFQNKPNSFEFKFKFEFKTHSLN